MFYAYFYTVSTPQVSVTERFASRNGPLTFSHPLVFTALIRADSKVQAERFVRESPRFRKTMNQNGQDWRTVPLTVTRTTQNGKVR